MPGQIFGPTGVLPAAGGGGAFALDTNAASAVAGNSSAGNYTLPAMTTNFANDVIVVCIVSNGGSVSSVTSAHVTFARHPGLTPPTNSGSTTSDLYTGLASSTLSGEVITVGSAASFTTAVAFAISGAKTSSWFDANASIPGTNTGGTPPTITSNASDAIGFGFESSSVDHTNTGGGFTLLNPACAPSGTALSNFLALSYKFSGGSAFSAAVWCTGATNAYVSSAIDKGP